MANSKSSSRNNSNIFLKTNTHKYFLLLKTKSKHMRKTILKLSALESTNKNNNKIALTSLYKI